MEHLLEQKLSILSVVEDTTVDGPGFRTAIYGAGCSHHCLGCHNPQSWELNNGTLMSVGELLQIVLADEFADVTFTGGDPFFQVEGFAALAKAIKQNSSKTIWCYTGYTIEQLMANPRFMPLLSLIDVLVDGPFIEALRTEEFLFRGSSNHRILKVKDIIAETY